MIIGVGAGGGGGTPTDLGVGAYRRALEIFGALVREVGPRQWGGQTPCTDWNVRELVNHLTVEQLWAPALLGGETLASVGSRFDGDQLGSDPVTAWGRACGAALAAWEAPGAWERTVDLSAGPTPSADYGFEMTADLLIHGWDLARAIRVDPPSDQDLAGMVLRRFEPRVESWRRAGIFGPPHPVEADADDMTRLVALSGRPTDWRPPGRT